MEESTKLVDEFTEALWYVVHTYSGYENKVANDLQTMVENRHLQELICDIKVPVEMVPEIDKNGKQKMVEHKLFPGYVLVKMVMNDDTWYVVRNTRGCTGFVGPASKPVPLTAEGGEDGRGEGCTAERRFCCRRYRADHRRPSGRLYGPCGGH